MFLDLAETHRIDEPALRIKTVVRRHVYVLWRAPHRWFDIAFWPLMDVILWGSLGTYVAQQDGPQQGVGAVPARPGS